MFWVRIVFDPIYKRHLYTRLELNEKNELVPAHSPLLDVQLKRKFKDIDNSRVDYTEVRKLSDFSDHFKS